MARREQVAADDSGTSLSLRKNDRGGFNRRAFASSAAVLTDSGGGFDGFERDR